MTIAVRIVLDSDDLVIDHFRGLYRWLSNFYDAPIRLNFSPAMIPGDDFIYNSTEAAYQAAKFLSLKKRLPFSYNITHRQAKEMGQAPGMRDDWETVGESGLLVKDEVMLGVLMQKFEIEPLRTKLIETWPADLIEGNDWHDVHFGVCNGKCRRGPHMPTGENMLGKLLMKVRVHYIMRLSAHITGT